MVHMRVYLTYVVKVTMWHFLAVCHLLVLIQQCVQIEFALQVLQPAEREALAWTIRRRRKNVVQITIELT